MLPWMLSPRLHNLVLVENSANYGEPCLMASANASSSFSVNASSGMVTLSTDSIDSSSGSAPISYTICYNGSGVGVGVTGTRWYNSFIQVSISQITSVGHHNLLHYTQGHTASSDAVGMRYHGSLAVNAILSLVDEELSCNTAASSISQTYPGMSHATGQTSGLQTAAGKQVTFNTRYLDVHKNYAVCYGTDSNVMYDSGIRLTVSTVSRLEYNYDQYTAYSSIATGQFARYMYSYNVAQLGCGSDSCGSDTGPAPTNRLPTPGGDRKFAMYGPNMLSKEAVAIIVDASKNGNNPCMDASDITTNNNTLVSGQMPSDASGQFLLPAVAGTGSEKQLEGSKIRSGSP